MKYEDAPFLIVIHCGGNDIGHFRKSAEFRATVKRILNKIAVLLPNTILVWTITDPQALEKVRMRINSHIHVFNKIWGKYLRKII